MSIQSLTIWNQEHSLWATFKLLSIQFLFIVITSHQSCKWRLTFGSVHQHYVLFIHSLEIWPVLFFSLTVPGTLLFPRLFQWLVSEKSTVSESQMTSCFFAGLSAVDSAKGMFLSRVWRLQHLPSRLVYLWKASFPRQVDRNLPVYRIPMTEVHNIIEELHELRRREVPSSVPTLFFFNLKSFPTHAYFILSLFPPHPITPTFVPSFPLLLPFASLVSVKSAHCCRVCTNPAFSKFSTKYSQKH